MRNVNRVELIGNLGADPEVRYTQSGQAVCNFRMATNERWNNKQGNAQSRTEWHRIVVWGKQAEACGQYLSKGRQVRVEGRLQTNKWKAADGSDRYTVQIVAHRVDFLSPPPKAQTEQEVVPSAEVDPTLEAEAAQVFGE